jgi:hypothetical protein
MTKYLAGVLSVIAVGVLLVAYGLLNPRTTLDASAAMAPAMRSLAVVDPVGARDADYGGAVAYVPAQNYAQPAAFVPVGYAPQVAAPVGTPVTYVPAVSNVEAAPRAVRTVAYEPAAPRRSNVQYVERAPKRDWKRTALIIGGSSATGAGVGAIFGGKKGALIGAAIGGGASTIYQTMKK